MGDAPKSRKQSIAANSLFSATAWLVPLIIGFIVTPILIRGLGTAEYGLFALLSGFIGYSFAFSIGRLVVRYVAEYTADKNVQGINQIISAALIISLGVGGLGVLLIGFGTPYIVTKVLRIDSSLRTVAEYSFYLANVTVLLTMLGQVFQYVLHGFQQFGRFVIISTAYAVLFGVGNVLLVKYNAGIIGLQIWSLFLSAALGVGYLIAVKRVFSEFRFTLDVPGFLWRSAIHYATSIILYQIFGNLLFIFERAWITRYFGTTETGHFALAAQIGIYAQTLAASIAAVFLPVMSESYRNTELLRSLYTKTTKILLSGLVFFIISIIFLGDSLLSIWISPEFAAGAYDLLVLQSFSFGIIALFVIVWQLNEAARAPGLNTVISAVWLIIAVISTFALTDTFGAKSVAIGRLIGITVTLPVIFFSEKRFLGKIQLFFWTNALLRLALPLAVLSALLCFLKSYVSGFVSLVIVGLLGAMVFFSGLLFAGYFTRDELEDFTIIRRILRGGRS